MTKPIEEDADKNDNITDNDLFDRVKAEINKNSRLNASHIDLITNNTEMESMTNTYRVV